MAQWFLLRNGQEHGPVTDQQLRELASKGKILATEQVRRSDLSQPILAGAIPNLFPKIAAATPQRQPVGAQPVANNEAKTNHFIPFLLTLALIGAGAGAFYFTYQWDRERRIGKALAAGEQLWQAGDKEKAVIEYQKIAHSLPDGDTRTTVMSRIAEVNPPPQRSEPEPAQPPEPLLVDEATRTAGKTDEPPAAADQSSVKSNETPAQDQTAAGSKAGSLDEVRLVETPTAHLIEGIWGSLQVSPDGRYLIANGHDVWNVGSREKLKCSQMLRDAPTGTYALKGFGTLSDLTFSPAGNRTASLTKDPQNRWHLVIHALQPQTLALSEDILLGFRDCAMPIWASDEKTIVIGCTGGIVARPSYAPPSVEGDQHGFVIDLAKQPPKVVRLINADHKFKPPITSPNARFISDNRQVVLTLQEIGKAKSVCHVFDVATGALVETKPVTAFPYQPPSWQLSILPNDDGRVEVRQTNDKRLMFVVGKPDGIRRMSPAISPDGRFVATALSQNKGIEVWDTSSGTTVPLTEYRQRLVRDARRDYMRAEAPPVSDALYQQIRIGMGLISIRKLLGGKGYKEARGDHVLKDVARVTESMELYHSKDHPGATIVLHYREEQVTTDPHLVEKSIEE